MKHYRIVSLIIGLTIFSVTMSFALCGPSQLNGFYDEYNNWQQADIDVWDCPEFGVHYTVITNGPAGYDGTYQYMDTLLDGTDRYQQEGTKIIYVDPEGVATIVMYY